MTAAKRMAAVIGPGLTAAMRMAAATREPLHGVPVPVGRRRSGAGGRSGGSGGAANGGAAR